MLDFFVCESFPALTWSMIVIRTVNCNANMRRCCYKCYPLEFVLLFYCSNQLSVFFTAHIKIHNHGISHKIYNKAPITYEPHYTVGNIATSVSILHNENTTAGLYFSSPQECQLVCHEAKSVDILLFCNPTKLYS